jgi:hypothetical protein
MLLKQLLVLQLHTLRTVVPLAQLYRTQSYARVNRLEVHHVAQRDRVFLVLSVLLAYIPDVLVQQITQFLAEFDDLVVDTLLQLLKETESSVLLSIVAHVDQGHDEHLVDIFEILSWDFVESVDSVFQH